MTMRDAVYVDPVEEKSIVAIQPKPAFRPLFEMATTREGRLAEDSTCRRCCSRGERSDRRQAIANT
jgi:hypothetical protein